MNEHSQQNNSESVSSEEQPQWKPLGRIERRVIGVLVEKAKTTPDTYPLTLNSITTGCNQKSNRSPQMDLDSDDILIALDNLRSIGAVIEIQGTGRVAKYKHQMYQWLGVDKVELAVVAELLLRGKQTLGELRARAARMEPIADISQLRPVCQTLMNKRLMVSLTPEGRGQIVDHGLYPDNEKPVAVEVQGFADEEHASPAGSISSRQTADSSVHVASATSDNQGEVSELKLQVQALQCSIEQLEQRLEKLESLVS